MVNLIRQLPKAKVDLSAKVTYVEQPSVYLSIFSLVATTPTELKLNIEHLYIVII